MIINKFKVLVAQKELRENRRLTYRTIHKETDLSTNTLTGFAKQKVTRFDASVLNALCDYFGCSVGDILEYVPDQEMKA